MRLYRLQNDVQCPVHDKRLGKLDINEMVWPNGRLHEERGIYISFATHKLWSSLLSSMGSLSFLPLILTSSQLVFCLSSALREMVYVFAPGSSALMAYVVVACTREPPSSKVRTMAEFSNEAAETMAAR